MYFLVKFSDNYTKANNFVKFFNQFCLHFHHWSHTHKCILYFTLELFKTEGIPTAVKGCTPFLSLR